MAMYACRAPCHPAARPPVAPSPSALSPGSSFRSLVNDQSGGVQGATRQEKGEECIGPPCSLLSHAHPTRGGHLGHSHCCHFHRALKEVPVEHVKTGACSHWRRYRGELRQGQAGRRHGSAHASRSVVGLRSPTLAAKKIGDSPIQSDMKWGPQTHLGAESQS